MKKKKRTPGREAARVITLTIIIALLVWIGADVIVNFTLTEYPDRPESDEGSGLVSQLLYYYENPAAAFSDGVVINEDYIIAALIPAKKYIDGRYDCSDFRMQTLLRLQYKYGDEIAYTSDTAARMLKEMFINAKYWITDPGDDSICYWSENHQILWAVAEYMAGQMWPDDVFTNNGITGLEHMNRARERIEIWLEHRFLYGFSEFNSNNYFRFNVSPASNFIEFAAEEDSLLVERMKMCLDMLFYEVASNMFNYVFQAPTGRAYESNMVGVSGDRMDDFIHYIWDTDDDYKTTSNGTFLNFYSMCNAKDSEDKPLYEVPEVIKEIGRDNLTRVIKSSQGLDVSEIAEMGFVGHSDEQIMMQFGMEAYTNPEVIQNTLTYFSKYGLLKNSFFNDFKYVNLSALKTFHLLEPISTNLNPMPNGIALQRANIYTYQTRFYQLATAQAYHPDSYGASQMLSVANLSDQAIVFTTHPAQLESTKTVGATPGYWAGFGRAPHAVQDENIMIQLYQIPEKSGFLELYDVPQFTHTYLPEAYFDEVIIDGRYAFARVGNAYISLTGASNLRYNEFHDYSAIALESGLQDYPDKRFDLIQEGNNQYWIYELSDATQEGFTDFMARIKANSVTYDGESEISYLSGGRNYGLTYNGDFTIEGVVQNLQYDRYDCEYAQGAREQKSYTYSFGGHSLTINYETGERVIG